jgi:hypothetical protein
MIAVPAAKAMMPRVMPSKSSMRESNATLTVPAIAT